MSISGIRLNILIGENVPRPAPPALTEVLSEVEVTHSDEERSGFQITFRVGRSGLKDLMDYPLMSNPLIKPCNRVILSVLMGSIPRVIMDGIITRQQLLPGQQPGESLMVITGQDISVMMDREEKVVEHPLQDESTIALKIIASYAQYGLIPVVIPPPLIDPPIPTERTPVQRGTDLKYLKDMAERFGYVFYVSPGPAPFTNTAYWGPPKRLDVPQRALSVNQGSATNVDDVRLRNEADQATFYEGNIQDRNNNQSVAVRTTGSVRPPLSSQPALMTQSCNRVRLFPQGNGLNATQAFARAQGMTDSSSDVIKIDGELDTLRYGDVLTARSVVGLRGVGMSYDGLYYVKSVTYVLRKGSFKQRFSLTREGLGSTTPVLRP